MRIEEIQREIVRSLPSLGLQAEVERTGHEFLPRELLKMAYDFAPDYQRRLELLWLLVEGVPEVAGHARALIVREEERLADFLAPVEGQVYELTIRMDGEATAEGFLCATWEQALRQLRYFMADPGWEDDYEWDVCVLKRRILRQEADTDETGWCRVDAQGRILMVDMDDGRSEWGECGETCVGCPRRCISHLEMAACPRFVEPWGFVRYPGLRGKTTYGVVAPPPVPGALETEYTIWPVTWKTVRFRDERSAFQSHWHAPLPQVEAVTAEELPLWLRQEAEEYRRWLMQAMVD